MEQDAKKSFKESLEEALNELGKVSIDELAKRYSKKANQVILATEEEKNCRFVGGQFTFICEEGEHFCMKMESYFQNAEKKWIAAKSQSEPVALTELVPSSAAELIAKKSISFELEAPKKDEKKAVADKKADADKPEA